MNSALHAREYGIERPQTLQRAEITRRIYSLELSRLKEVARVHHGWFNKCSWLLITMPAQKGKIN
jgi:hypothetical protein